MPDPPVAQPEHGGNGAAQASQEKSAGNDVAEIPPQPAIHFFRRWLRDWRQWDREDLQTAFNGILAGTAIAGIAGLVITSCLTYASLQETRRASKTAADAFQFTRAVVERPYLAFAGMVPHNFNENGRPYFVLTFENTGRTPALTVTGNVTIGVRPALIETAPRNYDPNGDFTLPPVPAQGKVTRWVASEKQWLSPVFTQLNSGKPRLFIFGHVSYADSSYQFPREEFCMVYRPTPGRPTDAIGIFDYCVASDEQSGPSQATPNDPLNDLLDGILQPIPPPGLEPRQ